MNIPRHLSAAAALLFAAPAAFASYHTFQIEQIYSNADGSVQFIVMHESLRADGESFWNGNMLTSTHAGVSQTFTFRKDLPGGSPGDGYGYGMMPSPTANKRVLIATQGFAALGLVTPDFVMPNGFLATGGGTLNYAGVDQITYSSLPTDGTHAIDRGSVEIPNVATNFAGASASVAAAAVTAFTPQAGLWWNAAESGSGYNFDYKHGVLVVTVFTYEAGTGHSEWYLASGPVTNNVFTATLDKYRNGQCVTCPYANPGPPAGNDGTITITFTSATSAVMQLPGRTTNVVPQPF